MSDEKILEFLAGNVRQRRAELGLTQEALADAAKMDVRYVQRIESGRANLTMMVLARLARALDVEPGALLEQAELPSRKRGRPAAKTSKRKG